MSEITLAQLQAQLQHFLLDKNKGDMSELTLETPSFSHNERLNIYYEGYRLRLIDALRNDYPALEKYVGEDIFIDLAHQYIEKYPSHHSSLRWLGEKLPIFLAQETLLATNKLACDLAAFEWAQVMAFDAADETTLSLENLKALQPEMWMTLGLTFCKSLQLVFCSTNAPELWQALLKTHSNVQEEIIEQQAWLIWRDDLQVVYRPLDNIEYTCLHLFMEGKRFPDVCTQLSECIPAEEVPMQVAQCLQRWLIANLITSIQTT